MIGARRAMTSNDVRANQTTTATYKLSVTMTSMSMKVLVLVAFNLRLCLSFHSFRDQRIHLSRSRFGAHQVSTPIPPELLTSDPWELFRDNHSGAWNGVWEVFDTLGDKLDESEVYF